MNSIKCPLKTALAIVISTTLAAPAFAYVTNTKQTSETSAQDEQKLYQIIVKYRNEPGNSAEMASAGTAKDNLNQVMSQRVSKVQSVAQSFGANISAKRQIVTGGWVFRSNVALKPAQMRELADKLAKSDSSIEYAEPDYIFHAMFVPTDPLFATSQWDMQASASQAGGLNLPGAWDITTGKNMVVAVLDTGYRPHPDLVANLVPAQNGIANQYGYNFITDPVAARITPPSGVTSARGWDALDQGDWTDPNDTVCPSQFGSSSSWHGTHVAGTIAALANGVGVIGVAPSAKVLPLRVLGKCGGHNSDIADAVAWASGTHINGIPDNTTPANVINLSLGGHGFCTKTSSNVFQQAMKNGTVIVVAAGNENIDAKVSNPANCPGVITVASSNILGGRSSYSNYGGTVTVAAPGGGATDAVQGGPPPKDVITSTLPTGSKTSTDDTTYGPMKGTSQATPHVAGVAALMLSVNPKLTPARVKQILVNTARPTPINCPGCGAGIVDATAAVKAAVGG